MLRLHTYSTHIVCVHCLLIPLFESASSPDLKVYFSPNESYVLVTICFCVISIENCYISRKFQRFAVKSDLIKNTKIKPCCLKPATNQVYSVNNLITHVVSSIHKTGLNWIRLERIFLSHNDSSRVSSIQITFAPTYEPSKMYGTTKHGLLTCK